MASLEDNGKIVLIDFEYGWWNPRYYDLANSINEFVSVYNHPVAPGLHFYYNNAATNTEIEQITKQYWTLLTGGEKVWSLAEKDCAKALEKTKACMLLNDYSRAVKQIIKLTELNETDPTLWYWAQLEGCCRRYKRSVQQFGGFGAI